MFLGDTITVTYTIAEIDPVRRRSKSAIEVTNQNGDDGRGRRAHPEVGAEER